MAIIFVRCKCASTQAGVMLLEALIGILLFSIGILALIAMYANSATASADAQYRLEAANYAQRIVNEMWIGSTHSDDPAVLSASVAGYAHQASGDDCEFSGTASANPAVIDWAGAIEAAGSGLPGVKDQYLQIKVDTVGVVNQASVTICWKPPSDVATAKPHRYTMVTVIQ